VVDVRHASFRCAEYLALARGRRIATVFTDSDDYPSFADITGDFVYVRTMRTDAALPQGHRAQALAQIAACAGAWRDGAEPHALPRVEAARASAARDVFVFFISGAKQNNPAAAMALLQHLRPTP
jgi:uncharacterized protein YecE (DUF72 family)